MNYTVTICQRFDRLLSHLRPIRMPGPIARWYLVLVLEVFQCYHFGSNLWGHTLQRDPYLIMEPTRLGIVSVFKSWFMIQLSFGLPGLESIWSSLGLPGIVPSWLGLNPYSSNGLMNCSKSNWFLFKSILNWFQLESMWFDCIKLRFDLSFESSPVSINLEFVWVFFGLNQIDLA